MKNRVIKFRVWDIPNNCFIPNDCYVISNDGKSLGMMIKNWNNYLIDEYMYSPNQTLNQFTGLTDKNGVSIYEGDILSFPTSNWMNQVVKVVWYEKQHCWALKNKHGIQHTTSGGRSYLINGKDLEVIGNIHENPELML